jgi:hypothetical protein
MDNLWTKEDTQLEEEKAWLEDCREYGKTPLEERAYALILGRNIK